MIICYTMLCYFSFGDFFCPFTPLPLKLQRMKKHPVNIIILHKCTKNRNHMIWGSWHMGYNGCNYFSFWAIFCAFSLLTNQNMKISKNWKKKKKETDGWTDGKSDRGTWQTNHTVTPIAKIFLWQKVQSRKFKTLSRIYQICSFSCNWN